jgi:Zn-dependent peptidase ImmA (M78 family)/DNA-binding XRE family transcriptional regulator
MSQLVSPDMLILARESRGLTQTELAEATGVSQGNISKYESGLLKVSDEHLAHIAEVLDYPTTLFHLSERRYGFGSSCTYHRKRQTMPVRELRMLLARLNICRIQVARLLNSAEIESENQFPRLDLDEYAGDCAHIAQLVRRMWKLAPGPVSNLVDAIEDAGGIVFADSFGTQKLDAISQWVPGLPPVFYINTDLPGERVRYTLAHELGHIVMHSVPTDNMEEEADRFAAEFLMPAADIGPDLNLASLPRLAQLKAYWKVSIAALIVRAKDLGAITPRQYRTLFEQLSRLGYRRAEPVPIPVEQPALLKELIEVHRSTFGYTVPELSLLLGLQEHEVRSQYLGERGIHALKRTQGSEKAHTG